MDQYVSEAVETLEAAKESDTKIGMLFTGGKDSMIMLDLWERHIGGQPPLLVIDTGNQFNEIYEFREKLREERGLEMDVRRNEEFLDTVINNDDDEREFAWDGFKTDGCCGALKIDVIGDFITDGYEELIVGRRAEDMGGELELEESTHEPYPHYRYHPLTNWSDAMVAAYIKKHSIELPELYHEGYEHTDCVDCTKKGEDNDEWSGMSQEKKEQLNNLREMGYM